MSRSVQLVKVSRNYVFPHIFNSANFRYINNKINISERVSTTVKMDGTFETIDNERYLHITDFDVVLGMEDMKVFATGIFPEAELSK